MRVPGSPTAAYHQAHHGEADYYSFATQFNRESKKWDPDQWAALVEIKATPPPTPAK